MRSPLAVVDSVKAGSAAALAGMDVGDRVTAVNGKEGFSLEELLAFRFDWETARDTRLTLDRAGAEREANLPQGNWGCEFRADLSNPALQRLVQARAELKASETREQGMKALEALAVEAEEAGFAQTGLWVRLDLARTLGDRHRWKEAREVLQRVRQLAPERSFWQISAVLREAETLGASGENDTAEAAFRRAKGLAEAGDSEMRLAAALSWWTRFEYTRGRLAEATTLGEAYQAICERLAPGSLAEAAGLNNLGVFALERGDLETSRALQARALEIRNRIAPGGLPVGRSLNNLGRLAQEMGDLAAAREYLINSLAIHQRLAPDGNACAANFDNLGIVAMMQGDLAAARAYHLRALAIEERLAPDGPTVAGTLNNLGVVARGQGDLAAARAYFLRALAIKERLAPDSRSTGAALTNLGVVAQDQGDLPSARAYYLRSMAIEERLAPGSLSLAECLNNLGVVEEDLGNPEPSEAYFLKALAIRRRLAPESLAMATSLHNRGIAARKRGDLPAARESSLKATEIRRQLAPGSLALADSLRELARLERLAHDLPRATDLLSEAVDCLETQRGKTGGESAKTTFSSAHGAFYTDLIAALLDAGRPEQALETLERSRARALLEIVSTRYLDLRGHIPPSLLDRRNQLARERKTLYEKLALADSHTDPRDIQAWRAGLLTLPQREDALAEEIRKASPLLAALEYPRPLDFRGMAAALAPGTLLLAFAVADKETFLFALRSPLCPGRDAVIGKGRRRGETTRLDPGKTPPASAGPAARDGRETPREGLSLRVLRLPLSRGALEESVRSFRDQLGPDAATETDSGSWKAAAAKLYEALLGKVSREIAACDRILLLPDGPLHLLPFTTLLPPAQPRFKGLKAGEALGLQKPISVEPSLTVYAELKARGPRARLPGQSAWTGFGDPAYPAPGKGEELRGGMAGWRTRGFTLVRLPGTRREIVGISSLFGRSARAFLGDQATETAVRALPKDTPYLHFACHGLIDAEFPMDSALALTPPPRAEPPDAASEGDHDTDGLLQAWEIIQDLAVDAECVVLSACETGTGKVLAGEGILGLTRAFFHAGARSVVVSLWPISDESTFLLMEAFYRELLSGTPRDVALMRAQRALGGGGAPPGRGPAPRAPDARPAAPNPRRDLSHPFYWAAFQLHGQGD
ncbi:MAG: CHAT domain-containing protein [Acidobacteria bacterium]|nr:CHAT domain-containing protein [Acidobacteriota bacterium]